MVLALLTGCGGGGGTAPPSGDNNPPLPPYNIYGVVRAEGDWALSGVDVSAYYKDDQNTVLDESKTDSQGRYYLWVPWSSPDKVYVIKAVKNGYQPQTQEIKLSSPDSPQEVNFTLKPEAKK